ncbi:LysR family transcriptional regulator [Mesobacterium pallidum]|uniref:LysR family transcriptional regulator n=1 Tax=Mesobacterium pallidum TaxID=2872037 RepID=UPI001EE1BB1A|nr:LysR family transcriptional regulator [Mesobacterium pallidum]
MDNWDEVRTAYQVARIGTVSGAAEILGVHHATVIRHIDALEGRMGVKLFQRHPRGYTPTEAGQDLLRVAQTTDEQFAQLEGRIKGRGAGVEGELVVTSLVNLAPFMVPALAAFREQYPEVTVRYLTGERLFRLEYGEAHLAVRAGSAPQNPDNVVLPFMDYAVGLYASDSYIARKGRPAGVEDFGAHDFVCHDNPESRALFYAWLRKHAPEDNMVFRSTDPRALELAVVNGAGIGFMPRMEAARFPDLQEVIPPLEAEWRSQLWLVTHVDLHRTAKVQALVRHLKEASKDIAC